MFIKNLIALIVLSYTSCLMAQKLNDGVMTNPMPISLLPEYSTIINAKELPYNFSTPLFNNDSLYLLHNSNADFSNQFIGGFTEKFKPVKWFKESSTRVNLDNGTAWVFKIGTKTGVNVGIMLDTLSVPKGAQLSFFYYNEDGSIQYEVDGVGYNMSESQNISPWGCKTMYIEYFEPTGFCSSFDFRILSWGYTFASKKRDVQTLNSLNKSSSLLKAGSYGTAVYNCNNDIMCSDPRIAHWKELANSVVYIRFQYDVPTATGTRTYTVNGSGVFINKAGDYSSPTDQVMLLTAGHLYKLTLDDNSVVDLASLPTNKYSRELIYGYKNDVCNSTKTISGKRISGDFSLLKIGTSYMTSVRDPSYDDNQDYALLKHERGIGIFASYGLTFVGWNKYTTVNQPPGVASFGHPNGDVMKICIETDDVVIYPSRPSLFMKYNFGIAEPGMSGGPVFNYQKNLIGWNSAVGTLGQCGDNTTHSFAGNFEALYPYIWEWIDPACIGYATLNKYPNSLPAHCYNCFLDASLGETGVDCGGPCKPCHIPVNVSLDSELKYIQLATVRANYSIVVDPNVAVSSPNIEKTFTAGEDVTLMKNVEFPKGTLMSMDVVPSYVELDTPRPCDEPCIHVAPQVTPNGDGLNDYLYMRQKSVVRYRIWINDRWGKQKFDSGTQFVDECDWIAVYDPKKLSGGTYFYLVEAWNCEGKQVTAKGNFLNNK